MAPRKTLGTSGQSNKNLSSLSVESGANQSKKHLMKEAPRENVINNGEQQKFQKLMTNYENSVNHQLDELKFNINKVNKK